MLGGGGYVFLALYFGCILPPFHDYLSWVYKFSPLGISDELSSQGEWGYSLGRFRLGPVGRFTERCGIIRPIYRIDTCARILGSTTVSMSIHTSTRHLWPYNCYVLK